VSSGCKHLLVAVFPLRCRADFEHRSVQSGVTSIKTSIHHPDLKLNHGPEPYASVQDSGASQALAAVFLGHMTLAARCVGLAAGRSPGAGPLSDATALALLERLLDIEARTSCPAGSHIGLLNNPVCLERFLQWRFLQCLSQPAD